MGNFIQYLPIFVPVIIIELVLMISALVHVLKHKTYNIGNRLLWIFLIVFLQIIGPVLYFILGRSED